MSSLFDFYTETIIYTNPFGISEVSNIEDLGMFEYNVENLDALSIILEQGLYSQISTLKQAETILGQDITVIKFSDQNNHFYYSLIYDSIELYEYPQALRIYREVI